MKITGKYQFLLLILLCSFGYQICVSQDNRTTGSYPYLFRNVHVEYLKPIHQFVRRPVDRRMPRYRIIGHEFSVKLDMITDNRYDYREPVSIACSFRGHTIEKDLIVRPEAEYFFDRSEASFFFNVQTEESGWIDCMIIRPKDYNDVIDIRTADYLSDRIAFYLMIPEDD
jgi:hypothetical protein